MLRYIAVLFGVTFMTGFAGIIGAAGSEEAFGFTAMLFLILFFASALYYSSAIGAARKPARRLGRAPG